MPISPQITITPVVSAPVPNVQTNAPSISPVSNDSSDEVRSFVPPTQLIPKRADASPVTVAAGSLTEDLGKTAEFEGVVPFGRETAEAAPASQDASDLTNTADLLDALRKRRIERERDVISTNTGSMAAISDVDVVDEPAPAVEDISQLSDADIEFDEGATAKIDIVPSDADETSAEAEKPKPKRTSMPSWDEIVFNTRSDD